MKDRKRITSASSVLPSLSDFSKKATNRAVLKTTIQHDLTLWPFALAILGGFGGILVNPSLFLFAAGAFTFSTASWVVNYFLRSNRFANEYLRILHEQLQRHKEKVLENLKEELSAFMLSTDEDLGGYAKQAAAQFEKSEEKLGQLREILGEKLNTGELTYGRYLGSAEQVYLSILDNLTEILNLSKSTKGIDVEYINYRFKELNELSKLEEADKKEKETLEERMGLRTEQLQKINDLLTRNEEAMTQIDKTTASLIKMKTVRGRASMDMERAVEELRRLAEKARDYSLE